MGFEADEIQNYNIEQYLTVEQIAEFREAFDLFLPDDKVVNIGLCKADFWWPDIPVDELEREVVAAKRGHLPLALLPATLRALGQSPERYDLDVLRRILDPALSFQEFCGVLHHYNRRRHMNDYDLMWEALGWRPDLTLIDLKVNDTALHHRQVIGSVGGVSLGIATAFEFSEFLLAHEALGASCEIEPSGTVGVRDGSGRWIDVIFDGSNVPGEEVPVELCDGCGEAFYGDESLGTVCAEFLPMLGEPEVETP